MLFHFRHAAILTVAILFTTAALGGNDAYSQSNASTDPSVSDNLNKPRRHFRVDRAAKLDGAAARKIYKRLRDAMAAGYALSRNAIARAYLSWKQYNTAPYASSTHGGRFVNNYANDAASAYGAYERSGALPPDAVIAKDSFMVAENGMATPGPMFIMEKMPSGFNYVSGDWRYTMIMPDGSLFGATKGANANRVEFCIGCHLAREKFDHLYFLPEKWRVK